MAWTYWLAGGCLLAGCCGLAIDLPAARFFTSWNPPAGLRKLLNLSEGFSHGFGALLIGWLFYTLAPERRHCLVRLFGCAFLSGGLANLFKLLLGRHRPTGYLLEANSIWESFSGWLPFNQAEWGDHRLQSFPSAHTATAVGLAVGLIWLLPRGRWLFGVLALLAALQRLESTSHFFSDVCFGAAIGSLVAGGCWDRRSLGFGFDWLEQRMTSNESSSEASPGGLSTAVATSKRAA